MQRTSGNPTREALAGLLRQRPGLTPSDAARALGVDRTTVQYHLRRLVKDGLVALGEAPGGVRCFAVGTVGRTQRGAFVAAMEASVLLDAIRGSPGVTQSDLSRRLSVPRPTLAWRLGRLRRAGLVRAERDGRAVRLHAVDPSPGLAPGAAWGGRGGKS